MIWGGCNIGLMPHACMDEHIKEFDHTRSTEISPIDELGKINQTVTQQGTLNVYGCVVMVHINPLLLLNSVTFNLTVPL